MKYLIFFLLISSNAFAALTVDNIPRVKTGGASPSIQDSVVYQQNSNVGIGSTGPLEKLEVNGTVRVDGFKLDTNPSAGHILVSGSTGIGTWMSPTTLPGGGGGSGTVSSGTADRVAIYDTAGTTVTSSSVITDDNTNVGIGSTAPQSKLVVNQGVSSSNTPLMVYANTNSFAEINIQNLSNGASASSDFVATSDNGNSTTNFIDMGVNGSGGGAAPFTGANHGYLYTSHFPLNLGAIGTNSYITFNTGATPTEYMRVDQAGNVGIASVNPVQKLDVIGTVKATALRATGISGSTQCVQADTNGNLSGTGSACGGAGSTPGGGLNAVQYNSPVGTFAGSESNLSMNGTNIGIGTVNGQAKLDVSSTATGALFFVQDNGPNDTSPFEIDGNGSVGIGTTLASPETKLAVMSGNVGIGTWAPIDALIVMGGNVGIGSFRPHSSLVIQSSANVTSFSGQSMQGNVAGNFGISNVNASASSAVNITGGAAVGSGLYLVSTSNASAAGVDFVQLKGNASGATVLMTARGNGNIGIGTISPYAKLQIIGNIGIGTGQSSSFQGTVPPNGGMIVETNIGIGTVNPGTSLDVNGVLRISNAGDTYFQGNIGLGTTIPMNTLSVLGNVGIGSTKYGGNVCVGGKEVGNSGGLCVSHNVGIGTLIPTAALQIFQGTANVGIGTYTSGTALCWKNCHATTGRCELGYATGTLTGNIWSGCN